MHHSDSTHPSNPRRSALATSLVVVFCVLVSALLVAGAFVLNPQRDGNTRPGSGSDQVSAEGTGQTEKPVLPQSAPPPAPATAPSLPSPLPSTAGSSVVPLPLESNDPALTAIPEASAPLRFSIAAAGIDVPVFPFTPPGNGEPIDPPRTLDGYWLTSFGTPGKGSVNTTYIIGHSWEGLNAPFNQLSSHVRSGDLIKVTTGTGAMMYVVDSVTIQDKTTLETADIWRIVPNRLVIISCYTGDLWGQNLVVTASPNP